MHDVRLLDRVLIKCRVPLNARYGPLTVTLMTAAGTGSAKSLVGNKATKIGMAKLTVK
jgi:hypothetical protein